MIVKCEQCQTRFKIPDDKVTEKGVKVRCTKCQHTFRVKKDGTPEAVGAAPAAAAAPDPFSKFGAPPPGNSAEETRPGMYTEGIEATKNPFEGPTRVGPPPAKKSAPSEPAPFDFASLPSPPSGPTSGESKPFDFGSLSPPSPSSGNQRGGIDPQPFDFGALPSPPSHAREAPKAAAPAPPPPSNYEPQSMDFSAPPAQMKIAPPRASPSAVATQTEVPVASPPGAGLLGDIPSMDGFGDGMQAQHEERGALFDMPSAPEPQVNQLQAPQDPTSVVAKISLKKVSAEQLQKEQQRGEVIPDAPRRSAAATVWNVISAAVFVLILAGAAAALLNDGSLSPSRIKSALGSQRDWVTTDVSNGLYDTRTGRPVFFVRGEVKNRSAKATRVKVRAEILDGEDLVRASETIANATPSPEDLFAVGSAEDLDKLSAKLNPQAPLVQPGQQAPFIVVFYEYPPDLKDFRVRVTALADDLKNYAR
jgi:predicted Zn finger-like uncharacterized protein